MEQTPPRYPVAPHPTIGQLFPLVPWLHRFLHCLLLSRLLGIYLVGLPDPNVLHGHAYGIINHALGRGQSWPYARRDLETSWPEVLQVDGQVGATLDSVKQAVTPSALR